MLLGSRNPSDADLVRLRAQGFGALISLLCEDEQPPGYRLEHARALGFVRYNLPVRDFHPPTLEQLGRFVGILDGLPPGTRTVLHCQAGIGRTGTFAAAWRIARGEPVTDAVAYVRRRRLGAIETAEQEAVLHAFAAHRAAPAARGSRP
ncbi:MAG TPA: protein-tyrosine phosphatase family protein [Burkholderiales bacterium]